MNSGAMTGNGSSNCVSSSACAAEGDGGGLISERIRFHVKRILPRFNDASSWSAGRETVASDSSPSACVMALGQAPATRASGTIICSIDSGGGCGAGAAASGGGFNSSGAGSGEDGLIGGRGNGAIG